MLNYKEFKIEERLNDSKKERKVKSGNQKKLKTKFKQFTQSEADEQREEIAKANNVYVNGSSAFK